MRQLHFDLLRLLEDDRQGPPGSRSAWGNARMCCMRTVPLGSAAEMASPAGLSSRHPCATAHFITAPMRWGTRPAVTRLMDQMGSSTLP